MGEGSTRYAPSLSTNGLGFSLAGAESLDGYGRALITMYGDGLPAQRSAYVSRLPGLTMLRVYPVNCGNKPRVWTHLTASLELEVI